MKHYIIIVLFLMGGMIHHSHAQTQIHFNYTPPSLPVANAGNDTIVNANSPFVLQGSVTGGTAPFLYLWQPGSYLNDSMILNPTAILPFQIPMTFTFGVRDSNGCISIDQVEITILSGLKEEALSSPCLDLFPNPNRGHFMLQGLGTTPSDIMVECYNIYGSRMEAINLPLATDPEDISLPGLAPGIYFLQVYHHGGVSLHKMIIQ